MIGCIIGAGSIGAMKPDKFDSPKTKNVLTHAHALYVLKKNEWIEDFYLIDVDFKKRTEAADKWGCKHSLNLLALKNSEKNIDFFVISTPNEFHYLTALQILEYFNPRYVIIEKPFCLNYNDAFDVYKKYQKRKIPIIINYGRRFCIELSTLRTEIINSNYGKVKACNIAYVRGFLRDASHALDFCNYLFGKFIHGQVLGSIANCHDDYNKMDLTMPVWCEFENCKNVYFTPCDGRDYSIFEFDIFCENARIQLLDHCRLTKIFKKKPDGIYGDFCSIDYGNFTEIENNLENTLYYLHLNSLLNYKNENDLICTGLDGLKVQEIYKELNIGQNKFI
jgi:predicted dehydrogenase